MTKFHINPDTSRVNICRAEVQCKFLDSTGNKVPHFETKEEAHTYNENVLKKEFGNFSSISKPKKNKKRINTINEDENIKLTSTMINEFNEIYDKLSHQQKHSIDYYTFCGSSAMNRVLHDKVREGDEDTVELEKKHIERLDSVFKSLELQKPSEKKVLYRYLSLDKNEDVNDFIKKNFQEGEEYSDAGFMSTTEDISFIAGYAKKHSRNRKFVILEIETDKGISCQKDEERVGSIQTFEKERLLPRDMKFKIDEIFESNIKIDTSREKLLKQFGSGGYIPSENITPIPSKKFNFIKLLEQKENIQEEIKNG